jgi:hypothetical protein
VNNAPDSAPQILGVIRASSWPGLFDCAHRWYWQNIVGLRSPSSGKAWLGSSVHCGTAKFDQAVLQGAPVTVLDAVDAAARCSRTRPRMWTGAMA